MGGSRGAGAQTDKSRRGSRGRRWRRARQALAGSQGRATAKTRAQELHGASTTQAGQGPHRDGQGRAQNGVRGRVEGVGVCGKREGCAAANRGPRGQRSVCWGVAGEWA